MRFFSFVLSVLLLFGCAFAQQPKAVPVEYNVGFCGGRTFTVVHLVLADNKLTFSHYMPSPGEVVKAAGDDLLVFSIKVEPKDKNGISKFSGDAKFGKGTLTIDGDLKEDRIIALQKVDGDLGHVIYGKVGVVDDMPKMVEDAYAGCITFGSIPLGEIPKVLRQYLDTKSDAQ